MIKLKDILLETPIGTYTTIGDFEKGASYKDPRDRLSVSHPATVQKVKDMLKNTSINFDFYFVNKPGQSYFLCLLWIKRHEEIPCDLLS